MPTCPPRYHNGKWSIPPLPPPPPPPPSYDGEVVEDYQKSLATYIISDVATATEVCEPICKGTLHVVDPRWELMQLLQVPRQEQK